MTVKVTLVGGPTAVLEYAGLKVVTDPTFDPPQSYPNPLVGSLNKTHGPAISIEELGKIDVVLASHEHDDNLDISGRELLASVPYGFTTPVVEGLLGGGVHAMSAGDSSTVPLPAGGELTVHAVQAKHGPDGIWQMVAPVIGFVLQSEGLPTIYVSGDNSELDVVEDISAKFGTIDLAILFAGGAGFDALGGANLTLSAETAAEATRILGAKKSVLIHTDSWSHFREDLAAGRAAFEAAGLTDRLIPLTPGQSAEIHV